MFEVRRDSLLLVCERAVDVCHLFDVAVLDRLVSHELLCEEVVLL